MLDRELLELERLHDLNMSRQAVSKFLKQYHLTHRIVRKPGSIGPGKITDNVLHAIEAKMLFDDETTATQPHKHQL